MSRIPRLVVGALWLVVILVPVSGFAQEAAAAAPAEVSAKTWLEHRAAIEQYLQSAKVVGEKEIPIGVTRPKRMQLEPGGPVEYFAFKNIQPGHQGGFWESYKSEIAAYELDKLLGLDMVPPTVEKRVKGSLGAAVMWCSPTKNFKEMGGVPQTSALPGRYVAHWVRQMVRAKMFDNLIGNKDPNLGNWLVDPAWNLILIDKSRAFATDKDLVHKEMSNVDMVLWQKMQALTEESLIGALGKWIGKGEVRAMLERRKKMQQVFDQLIADKGDAVIMR
jgi:hypothetical protein